MLKYKTLNKIYSCIIYNDLPSPPKIYIIITTYLKESSIPLIPNNNDQSDLGHRFITNIFLIYNQLLSKSLNCINIS